MALAHYCKDHELLYAHTPAASPANPSTRAFSIQLEHCYTVVVVGNFASALYLNVFSAHFHGLTQPIVEVEYILQASLASCSNTTSKYSVLPY